MESMKKIARGAGCFNGMGLHGVVYEQDDEASPVACYLTREKDGVGRAYPVEFTFLTFSL